MRVTVSDSRVGIDPNALERIFDPFYTTKSSGMGIGLSVSRTIIEQHQGRLWIEPSEGPGSASLLPFLAARSTAKWVAPTARDL